MPKAKDPENLSQIIEELENALIGGDPDSELYARQAKILETFYGIRNGDKPKRTDLKDWIPVIGTLSSVVVIAVFEAFGHTIVSKGLAFVAKPKS